MELSSSPFFFYLANKTSKHLYHYQILSAQENLRSTENHDYFVFQMYTFVTRISMNAMSHLPHAFPLNSQ